METAENVATLPRDQLLCALLIVIPRLREPEAFQSICDVFDEIGYDALAAAIEYRMANTRDAKRQKAFIYQALAGLNQYPALLRNHRIGSWVDSLFTHRLYSPLHIVPLLGCLEHRPHSDPERISTEKISDLKHAKDLIATNDESWQRAIDGFEHATEAIKTDTDKLIERATMFSRVSEESAHGDPVGWFSAMFVPSLRAA